MQMESRRAIQADHRDAHFPIRSASGSDVALRTDGRLEHVPRRVRSGLLTDDASGSEGSRPESSSQSCFFSLGPHSLRQDACAGSHRRQLRPRRQKRSVRCEHERSCRPNVASSHRAESGSEPGFYRRGNPCRTSAEFQFGADRATENKKQLEKLTEDLAGLRETINRVQNASMLEKLKKGFSKEEISVAQKQIGEKQALQKRLQSIQQALTTELMRTESQAPI